MTTEREKLSYVTIVPDHHDRIIWRNKYYHLPLDREQKQAEIDALRAELEQVKTNALMLFNAVVDSGISNNQFESAENIYKALSATSEQIEAYKQGLIAKAKEEQRERDAYICAMLPSEWIYPVELPHPAIACEQCADAIRNNKE